nr:unnamed protein product [Callosobruchus chinensis]
MTTTPIETRKNLVIMRNWQRLQQKFCGPKF